MPAMLPTEALFMAAETKSRPMHVGVVQLFHPPAGPAADNAARRLFELLRSYTEVAGRFRLKPSKRRPLWWSQVDAICPDEHLQLLSLPAESTLEDLAGHIAALHETCLPRDRPLWQTYVIDGLPDNSFALYTKIHHALMDGVSAIQLCNNRLSADPAEQCWAPWSPKYDRLNATAGEGNTSMGSLLRASVSAIGDVVGLVPASVRVAHAVVTNPDTVLPIGAPMSALNGPTHGGRTYAIGSWSTERLSRVANSRKVSVHEVLLAMCSGALRSHLLDEGALPEKSLTALVPIPLALRDERFAGSSEYSQNKSGVIVVDLGTAVGNPNGRVHTVARSVGAARTVIDMLSPLQFTMLSRATMSLLGLCSVPGYRDLLPPPFNTVIATVPGPETARYCNGAQLTGQHCVNLLVDGLAVSFTFGRCDSRVGVGVIACADIVKNPSDLIDRLEAALVELE